MHTDSSLYYIVHELTIYVIVCESIDINISDQFMKYYSLRS